MSATKRAPCPQCNRGPKDTALAITTDERGTVSYCHRCGFTSADNVLPLRPVAPAPLKSVAVDWSVTAERLWRSTKPLRGTIGATYLERRGCLMPPKDSHLRFMPGSPEFPPSLCALVTDTITARKMSLHFTKLRADGAGKAGTARDKLLLRGHRKRGGVIRLWPDEAVTTGLAIAEGIETALAAAHIATPVWAAVDAGNLAQIPVLTGIEALTIFADHDEAGMRAARSCGRRWQAAGREVRIVRSRTAGHDIADEVAA